MEKVILLNKHQCRGLYLRYLTRVYRAWEQMPNFSRKDYLPFNIYRAKICRSFSLPKQEAIELMYLFVDLGYFEIVKTKGIRLNYQIKESS